MGRLTKYLKQSAIVENALLDNSGNAVLDAYGQPTFDYPVVVACRKEPYRERSRTSYGQFVSYMHTYYFDESVVIRSGDKVDGHEVQRIEDYIDGMGSLVGYKVDV